MPGYVIFDIRITDPDAYGPYRERAGATVEAYGGRYVVRGGAHEVIEGDWDPERVVVVEFPSVERAREWYHSAEYQEIAPMRQRASESKGLIVEGAS